jgi:hypothetical protein
MELKSAEKEVEHDIDFDDEGNVVLKKRVKVRMGSKSRAGGSQFEARVRKDLEEKGWVVDKWSNNVDLDEGKIVPCKRRTIPLKKGGAGIKGNPFIRIISSVGTGFPDFVCFQLMERGKYKVIGVEVKMNGNLSRVEKEKCAWYLEKGVFSEILVASKVKERGRVLVEYVDVGEALGRMRG